MSSSTKAFVLATAAERVREAQKKKQQQLISDKQPVAATSTSQRRRSSAASLAKKAAEAAEKAAEELELLEAERLAEENERLEMEERMIADAKRKITESNFLGSSQGPRGRRSSGVSSGSGGRLSRGTRDEENNTLTSIPTKRAPVTRTPPPVSIQPIVRPQPINAVTQVQNSATLNASKALAAVERAKVAKLALADTIAASQAVSASPIRSASRRSTGESTRMASTISTNAEPENNIVYEDAGLTMTQRKRRSSVKASFREEQIPTPPNITAVEDHIDSPRMPTPREVLRHLFDPPAASFWTGSQQQPTTMIGSLVGRGQQAALQFLSSSNIPITRTATVDGTVPVNSISSFAASAVSAASSAFSQARSPGILDMSMLGLGSTNPAPKAAASPFTQTIPHQRPPFEDSPSVTSAGRGGTNKTRPSNSSDPIIAEPSSSGLRHRSVGQPLINSSLISSSSSSFFSPTTEKTIKTQLAKIEHRKGVQTYGTWTAGLLAVCILFYSFTYYLLPLYSRHERFEAIKSYLRQRYGAAECAAPFGSSPSLFVDKAKVSYKDIYSAFCGGKTSSVGSPCERAVEDVFSSTLLFDVSIPDPSGGKGALSIRLDDNKAPLTLNTLVVRARDGSWTLECRLQMIFGWFKTQIIKHKLALFLFVVLVIAAIMARRYYTRILKENEAKQKTRELTEYFAKIIAEVAQENPYAQVPAGSNLMEHCIQGQGELAQEDKEDTEELKKLYAEALRLVPNLYNVDVRGVGEGASIYFPKVIR